MALRASARLLWGILQVAFLPVARCATLTWKGGTGEWAVSSNWNPAKVPTVGDTANIDSGEVYVRQDVEVNELSVRSTAKLNLGRDGNCPTGWLGVSSKCYKAFSDALTWEESEMFCRQFSSSSWNTCMTLTSSADSTEYPNLEEWTTASTHLCRRFEDANLVNIESAEENEITHSLCRGLGAETCWIGLTDIREEGEWLWSDRSNRLALGKDNRDPRFRAWKKGEPSNLQVGLVEEDCAALESHTRGIALNDGRWNDMPCASKMPYVCQMHGQTPEYTVTVASKFTWGGSAVLAGPGKVVLSTSTVANIEDADTKEMQGTISLVNGGDLRWQTGNIKASEGSSIVNDAKMVISSAVELQEGAGQFAMAPSLTVSAGGTLESAGAGTTAIAARLHTAGTVDVQGGELSFESGGVSEPESNYNIAAGGVLRFAGANRQQLTHVDTQTVTTSTLAPVVTHGGFFKLRYDGRETACMPFHATAELVETELSKLATIAEKLGVKVSRVGDGSLHHKPWHAALVEMDTSSDGGITPRAAGSDPDEALLDREEWQRSRGSDPTFDIRFDLNHDGFIDAEEWGREVGWRYGYRYVVSLDRSDEYPADAAAGADKALPLLEVVQGAGSGCGEAHYLAMPYLSDATAVGATDYLKAKRSSEVTVEHRCVESGSVVPAKAATVVDGKQVCAATVDFAVARLQAAGISGVRGAGTVEFAGGSHRLPHLLYARVLVTGGEVTLAASRVAFAEKLTVAGGRVLLTGTGFEGEDAAVLLYAPPDHAGRAHSGLLAPPTVHARMADLELASGDVVVVGHNSRVDVGGGMVWREGTLAGTCTMTVNRFLTLSGPGQKTLRNTWQLVNRAQAVWSGGNIVGSEGALILNTGLFDIRTGDDFLVGTPDAEPGAGVAEVDVKRGASPSTQWSRGWYPNPACQGPMCAEAPVFANEGLVRKLEGGETRFESVFDNDGVVEVYFSILTLDGNGTMTGEEVAVEDPEHRFPDVAVNRTAEAAAAAARARAGAAAALDNPGLPAMDCACGSSGAVKGRYTTLHRHAVTKFRLRFDSAAAVYPGERLRFHLNQSGAMRFGTDMNVSVLFRSPGNISALARWVVDNTTTELLDPIPVTLEVELTGSSALPHGRELDLVVVPSEDLEQFNASDANESARLGDYATGAYSPLVHRNVMHKSFERIMPVTLCRRADNFPAAAAYDPARHAEPTVDHTVRTVCETYKVRTEDRSAIGCTCSANRKPPRRAAAEVAPEPIGDFYVPKHTGGFVVARPSTTLRFGRGSCVIESAFLMGTGVVEFTGGTHRLLTHEVDAEVRVTGGTLVVESPFFQLVDANSRQSHLYNAMDRTRFALLDGFVNFTAVAPRFTVNGNMLVGGGYLWMRSQSTHSAEYKKQRGVVRVVNRLEWLGGTMDGNAELRSGGGLAIGGGTKYLKRSWAVINYAEAYWHSGDIVNTPGSTFINKGTLEMQDQAPVPRQQLAGVDESSRHRGPAAYLHSWSRF